MARRELSPQAQELLRQAAEDYAGRTAADPMKAGDQRGDVAHAMLSAQRGAAIRWSTPPEAKPGDRDAK